MPIASSDRVMLVPQIKSAGHETEIKFIVTPQTLKALQQWERLSGATPSRTQRHRSVYFDTAAGDLDRHKAVLRVRTANRRRLLTFKWNGTFAGGAFERGEMEVPILSETPDITLFGPQIARLIEEICQSRPLLPVYETIVRRTTYRVNSNASDIEVACDAGQIIAGPEAEPICEVELELKSGHPAELFQFGIALSEAFPVLIGCQSKSARGALLRKAAPPAIIHAPKAKADQPNVDEAISLSLNNCVQHFLGNWPAYHHGDRVKAVHQMRVAMRRMRSIIGVFQRSFPCADFIQFRQQARDVAAAMGDARNWDVFIDLLQNGPVAAFPNEPGFKPLLADAERQRRIGYEHVSATVGARETTRFILSMQTFIARHGWRNGPTGESLPVLTAPAEDFYIENLTRIQLKILKEGKHFDELTPHHRHELRKNLKKLRYLVDLFSDLFNMRDETKKYTRIVAALQDQLGVLNDLAVANDMAAKLHTGPDLAASRAVGIIIGWCGRGAAIDDTEVLEAWKSFKKLKFVDS